MDQLGLEPMLGPIDLRQVGQQSSEAILYQSLSAKRLCGVDSDYGIRVLLASLAYAKAFYHYVYASEIL